MSHTTTEQPHPEKLSAALISLLNHAEGLCKQSPDPQDFIAFVCVSSYLNAWNPQEPKDVVSAECLVRTLVKAAVASISNQA